MADGAIGSRESRLVCARYVMRHPIAFREYTVQRTYRRRVWHRYSFSPVLLAMDQGDTLLAAGRGAGKSFIVLEPEFVRNAINRPGEESLLTSLRRIHTVDRMERVIDYFLMPMFRRWLRKTDEVQAVAAKGMGPILRQPAYRIHLRNDHVIWGISVGDDPDARMAQGKHAAFRAVEEAQLYPARAWMKIEGATDPRGCRTIMAGVPDGRLDTPFRNADGGVAQFEGKKHGGTGIQSFSGRRFHISRRHDPYFDQAVKQKMVDTYGGEESDNFLQEVDAENGSPTWSAWDLNAIYRCMTLGKPPHWWPVDISGQFYKDHGLTPSQACSDLPGEASPGLTVLSLDVGYSQPSEGGVYRLRSDGRWHQLARFELTNRMEHDVQAMIVDEIGKRYDADYLAIDTTDGEGRAIATQLEADWGSYDPEAPRGVRQGKVHRIAFNENVVTEYLANGEPGAVEVTKMVAVRWLRGLFTRGEFALYADEDIITEFNQEMEAKGLDGVVRIKTPPTVHIPEQMRVFAMVIFRLNPPRPPQSNTTAGVLPMFNPDPSPWASPVGAFF